MRLRLTLRSLCTLTLAAALLALTPFGRALAPVDRDPAEGAQTQPNDPRPARIVAPVTDEIRSTLKGNVHPLALARYDRGPAPAAMATGRMMLLLRRSDAQTTALHHYLDDVQNPDSPHYRQWLTPASYGANYGISDADLATVSAWLTGEGFKVERVPAARNVILFSGSVGAIQAAFHTSIHSYLVNGEQHYANNTDPQIPAALTPVVAGISPLNDFHAKPDHTLGRQGVFDTEAKRIRPDLTLQDSSGGHYLFVDPADAATIYNTPNAQLNRNYSASKSLDGTGVTIGILGYSDLNVGDVQNYRAAFLNDSAHPPQTIVDGNDPGVLDGGYAVEALLDSEVAGGLAPGASINYYSAGSTDLADGLVLAALRALDDNQVSILNVSYSNCEATLGASGNQLFSELWEQAAAQGISVVVSSGDNGSAGCDDENAEEFATQGLAVSGIASTPYNLVVGGTDFPDLASAFSTYAQSTSGGSAPYYGTALSYIPESPWNDSVVTNGLLSENTAYRDSSNGATNIVAASGGVSSASYCAMALDADGNCPRTLTGYPKPAFQQAVTSSDHVRDLPDVALFSAAGKNNAVWVLCSDSNTSGDTSEDYTNCLTSGGTFTNQTNFDGVGGTSASAPAFAGILALVSQSLGGVRLGQANNVLYNLAAKSSDASIFHIVLGNNSVPCSAGSPDCNSDDFLSGYNAGPGYSEAAGLGSLNVTALVNAWPSAGFTSTATSLTAGTSSSDLGTSAISVTHGTPLYFGVAVSPASAVGDVSVTNTSGVTNNAANFSDFVTLGSNGTGAFNANNLPGGTYTISAYYEGDATHSASISTPINVTVSPEPSTTVLSLQATDPATGLHVTGTTFPYGYYGFLDAQTYGNNSTRDSQGNIIPDGIPTGSINFFSTGSGNFATVAYFNSSGFAQATLNQFVPASYSVYAYFFDGDASFSPSKSAPLSFTVTPAQTAISLQQSANNISPSGSVTIMSTLTTDSVGYYPSGEVTLSVSGGGLYETTYALGLSANGTVQERYNFVVPASGLAVGTNSITVNYPGDGSYAASSATTTVTVSSTAPAPSFSLSGPSSGISISAPGQTGTGTITLTPANGFTGAVTLTCSVGAPSSGVAPTCSIPTTETLSSTAPVTAALSVATTAGTAANRLPLNRFFTPGSEAGGGLALAGLLLLLRPRRWSRFAAILLVVSGTLAGSLAMTGCGSSSGSGGGGGGGTTGTPAGSYTVTVSGVSAGVTAKTTVTVTVQ
jgi:hypothetical protein